VLLISGGLFDNVLDEEFRAIREYARLRPPPRMGMPCGGGHRRSGL
jgi:hypothetical protein